MKKIISVLAIILLIGFVSCSEKEETTPSKQCNCGTIANEGTEFAGETLYFWFEVRSDCSGNKKKFYFDEDFWLNHYAGDVICVTGQSGW